VTGEAPGDRSSEAPAGRSGGARRRPVRDALARRREARGPRVLVKTGGGQTRALALDDPASRAALEAAEGLISAAQSGSDR
jgi:hypothetical protein